MHAIDCKVGGSIKARILQMASCGRIGSAWDESVVPSAGRKGGRCMSGIDPGSAMIHDPRLNKEILS